MTWQQRLLGVLLLIVVALAPTTAAVCAIGCHDDTRAAAHCQEAGGSSSEFQLRGPAAHDCGSHGVLIADVVTPAQLRVALLVSAVSLAHPLLDAPRSGGGTSLLTFASGAPPGSEPPTATPSILRV